MRHATSGSARSVPLLLAAGVAAPLHAHPAAPGPHAPEVPGIGVRTATNPARLAGHLYVNPASGDVVFTPAEEYLRNRAGRAWRATGDDITGDGLADVWINTNSDPCGLGTTASPNTNIALLDTPTTQGDFHLYKAQLAEPDARVGTLSFSFWTSITDTDTNSDTIADGNTGGHGIELTFWDKEDLYGKGCTCADVTRTKIVTLELTNLPGPLSAPLPGYLLGYVLTFDLSATGDEFEIADSDGVGPANGNFNPFIGAIDTDTDSDTVPDVRCADTDGNGTIDWSFSLRAIQPNDRPPGSIGYQIAAPGIAGVPGVLATDGVTPISGTPGADDGVIDYINRTTPLQWDNTRVVRSSVIEPMGLGFPFTSNALPVPTLISRFSFFFASLGENPDPTVIPTGPLSCPGVANSDFFGWGGVHPPDGAFYGGLNCTIDDDLDTVPDGRPYTGCYLALSGATHPGCGPADCDANDTLNIDDIDCFAAGFLAGDLTRADCDAGGSLNIDDIDCFAAAFLAGCG